MAVWLPWPSKIRRRDLLFVLSHSDDVVVESIELKVVVLIEATERKTRS